MNCLKYMIEKRKKSKTLIPGFLQVGRDYHTLTAVGDKLVATGGYGNSVKLNSVEILNPGSSGWTDPGWSLNEPGNS